MALLAAWNLDSSLARTGRENNEKSVAVTQVKDGGALNLGGKRVITELCSM